MGAGPLGQGVEEPALLLDVVQHADRQVHDRDREAEVADPGPGQHRRPPVRAAEAQRAGEADPLDVGQRAPHQERVAHAAAPHAVRRDVRAGEPELVGDRRGLVRPARATRAPVDLLEAEHVGVEAAARRRSAGRDRWGCLAPIDP